MNHPDCSRVPWAALAMLMFTEFLALTAALGMALEYGRPQAARLDGRRGRCGRIEAVQGCRRKTQFRRAVHWRKDQAKTHKNQDCAFIFWNMKLTSGILYCYQSKFLMNVGMKNCDWLIAYILSWWKMSLSWHNIWIECLFRLEIMQILWF